MKKTSLTLLAAFAAGAAVLLTPTTARAQVFYAENDGDGTIDEVSSSGIATPPFVTGLSEPFGLVSDSSGNLFESDDGANTINMITRTGSVSVFATGLSGPAGLAINNSGVLFESDNGSDTINEITSGNTVTPFNTNVPINDLVGLAFDKSGNLYGADESDGVIDKISPTGVVTPYSTGFSAPVDLAFDQSGNLFVTDLGSDEIDEIAPGGGAFSVYSSGANGTIAPVGLAFDSAGNLYDTDEGNNSLNEIASNGAVTPLTTGLNGPTFIALQVVQVVPEPSSYLLGLMALGLLAFAIRRRRSVVPIA